MSRARIPFWVIAVLLVLLATALQAGGGISLYGVKPNFIISVLVVISFFIDNLALYLLLILLATLGVSFGPGISKEGVAIVLVALAAFVGKSRIVWPELWGAGIATALATVGLYLLIDPVFIWQHPGLLLLEVVYTVIIGLLLFELLYWWRRRDQS